NWDVQQLAALVKVGTPVEIVGEAPGYHHIIELSYAQPTAKPSTVSLSAAVAPSRSAPVAP
ncbi:MAG: L,D-transpeptidase family protein, partial [Acidithiobacillus sp.]